MYDREDTLGLTAVEPQDNEITVEDLPGPASSLSSSLPVSAAQAFDLFCQSGNASDWMSVVRTSQVLSEDELGRPASTAFLATLERATMGYTLFYTYEEGRNALSWSTAQNSSTVIRGCASFAPLGDKACMMHYNLQIFSRMKLPRWGSSMYDGHPASAVVSDFREYLSRLH